MCSASGPLKSRHGQKITGAPPGEEKVIRERKLQVDMELEITTTVSGSSYLTAFHLVFVLSGHKRQRKNMRVGNISFRARQWSEEE